MVMVLAPKKVEKPVVKGASTKSASGKPNAKPAKENQFESKEILTAQAPEISVE